MFAEGWFCKPSSTAANGQEVYGADAPVRCLFAALEPSGEDAEDDAVAAAAAAAPPPPLLLPPPALLELDTDADADAGDAAAHRKQTTAAASSPYAQVE